MKRPRGLRARLALTFAGFGALLAATSGGLIYMVFHDSEDAVQERLLRAELDGLRSAGMPAPGEAARLTRYLAAYRGLGAVPESLRGSLAGLEPGMHELGDGTFAEDSAGSYHVVVERLKGGDLLYVVHDTTAFEASEELSASLLAGILTSVGLVAVIGAALGGTVARTVVRPVETLADVVRAGLPEAVPDRIDPRAYPEEVALLADALREATARVRAAAERERQFASNASHELRTPVTVIRGAAELLEALPEAASPRVHRPLERILRATVAMEEIVEVFLLLARDDEVRTGRREVPLRDLVEDVVDQHRRLASPGVVVEVQVPDGIRLAAPERVLSIVLGNLLANALLRTDRGRVEVRWQEGVVAVEDTGPGMPPHLLERVTDRHVRGEWGGHGLGLAIVRTLCERCGWRLRLESAEGIGTTARLEFEGRPVPPGPPGSSPSPTALHDLSAELRVQREG